MSFVKIKAGSQVTPANDNTVVLGGDAVELLKEQIRALVGRGFYGVTSVRLVWTNGQITEVQQEVDQQVRRA